MKDSQPHGNHKEEVFELRETIFQPEDPKKISFEKEELKNHHNDQPLKGYHLSHPNIAPGSKSSHQVEFGNLNKIKSLRGLEGENQPEFVSERKFAVQKDSSIQQVQNKNGELGLSVFIWVYLVVEYSWLGVLNF